MFMSGVMAVENVISQAGVNISRQEDPEFEVDESPILQRLT
jgi:hypothetical protein